MDMDDSPHNWLAFSLSNQPSFLEAFSSEQHHQGVTEGEDDGDAGMANLAMLADMGPKLEDFLGSCREPVGRYSSGKEIDVHVADSVMCEYNELKTIASSYLSGTPAANRPEEKAIVPAETRKAVETFGQRTSIYRGVTRHRWTGRYEAHLWDNSCRREGQSRKGRQVYLGGYDKEDKAARAYDLAALKYWGPTTTTNFPVSNYEKEVEEMQNMSRQEFVASLRRKSSGFSRGASMYRGVTRHHQHGRWQARIGRVAGNKDLYLGTFSTQEEAAEAYDIAAIKFRGLNAVTNFDMSRYDVKSIANSSLPIGGMSGRTSKATESSSSSSSDTLSIEANRETTAFGFAPLPIRQDHDYWTMVALHQQQQQQLGLGLGFGVNMDFSTGSASVSTGQECAAGNLVWSNGVLQLQQQPEQSDSGNGYNSIPYATPITALGGSYEGNWVKPAAPTYYYHPVGKQNGALQTPIYGIE